MESATFDHKSGALSTALSWPCGERGGVDIKIDRYVLYKTRDWHRDCEQTGSKKCGRYEFAQTEGGKWLWSFLGAASLAVFCLVTCHRWVVVCCGLSVFWDPWCRSVYEGEIGCYCWMTQADWPVKLNVSSKTFMGKIIEIDKLRQLFSWCFEPN